MPALSASKFRAALAALLICSAIACGRAPRPHYDVVVAGGTVYDGSGGPGVRSDVGIVGDKVAAVGDLHDADAATTIRADGFAVAPGFVNMMSGDDSLRVDGRSMSDLKQGVTTEIFGEGDSMGPLTEAMRGRRLAGQGDAKYPMSWLTLHEAMVDLEKRGVTPNFASFIGAATLREYAVGLDDKRATPEQLQVMRDLVEREMKDGALGVASALIYAPGFYASTEELTEISKAAARHHGMYISHMRSEGNRLVEAVDELIRISRDAGLPAEIYHLKAAGQANWPKMDRVLEDGRERAQGGAAHHGGYVHVHGGWHRPRRRDAAVGGGRRLRGAVQTPARPGAAQEDRRGDPDAVGRVGEPVPRGRLTRPHPADRVQVRGAQAAHRQDARRGRAHARQVA
jgi:N-acyl-D-amino-acid deacylase